MGHLTARPQEASPWSILHSGRLGPVCLGLAEPQQLRHSGVSMWSTGPSPATADGLLAFRMPIAKPWGTIDPGSASRPGTSKNP